MIAAAQPIQRPRDAKLLVVDTSGFITHAPRSRFVDFLRPADLVIANDAATLPASLHGTHVPTAAEIEVRLAGRPSLAAAHVYAFSAVVFGAGDFRTRTEDRPPPPPLAPGDHLSLGSAPSGVEKPLSATVDALLDHPRLVLLRFRGSPDEVWEGLARYGRPIQYAHVTTPLAMWDVWTPIAAVPVAFEPPSAAFALNGGSIQAMRERGIAFATITLAAGISSTGDPALDRRLPLDEAYRIPAATASAIRDARARGGRIVAVGYHSSARPRDALRPTASSMQGRMANQRRAAQRLKTLRHPPGTHDLGAALRDAAGVVTTTRGRCECGARRAGLPTHDSAIRC